MKKLLLILLTIILINNLIIVKIKADSTSQVLSYGTYDNAQKIFKEVAKSFYIRGRNIQYNTAKKAFSYSPEEATSQDQRYKTCSSYGYGVFSEAFGMKNVGYYLDSDNKWTYDHNNYESFPIGSDLALIEARTYYNNYKNDSTKMNGNYLLYYNKPSSDIKYAYNNATTVSKFVEIVQPGDLFVQSGHVFIAYDKIEYSNGTKDIILLESTGGNSIPSRINGLGVLYFNVKVGNAFSDDKDINKNSILNMPEQGTVKAVKLREYSWVSSGKMGCSKTECAVIRPFYNDNGTAKFNYSINVEQYNKSLLRLKYPGLYIEKTVDKGDNNSINLGDELTYTILVKNRSDAFVSEKTNYDKTLYIEETIDDKVEYTSSTPNGTVSGNKISWTVSKLNVGDSTELKYTVRVKKSNSIINSEIVANGKYMEKKGDTVYITSGTVNNKIVPKKENHDKAYNECYSSKKSQYSGLTLINEIYKCADNVDWNFDKFTFSGLIGKTDKIESNYQLQNAAYIKKNLDNNHEKFKKMILNNYWNALVLFKNDKYYYVLPRYEGNNQEVAIISDRYVLSDSEYSLGPETRARSISNIAFKDGDILIYYVKYKGSSSTYLSSALAKNTDEDGTYAFIYLDGKFVGVNYNGESNQRNLFAYTYYKNRTPNDNLWTYYNSYVNNREDVNDQESILEWVNFQTLFGKDYYIILRPELYSTIIFRLKNMEIDNSKRIFKKIIVNSTLKDLFDTTENNDSLQIYNSSNELLYSKSNQNKVANLATGQYVKYNDEVGNLVTYKISVSGDPSGDGNISSLDYIKVKNHIMGSKTIEGNEFIDAADYNSDNKISALDYVGIRNTIMK